MLKDIDHLIKFEYRTLTSRVIQDFYLPCLSEAIVYKRAVGFFSTKLLSLLSYGLNKIYEKNGKIQFLISEKISRTDCNGIIIL